MVAVKSQIFLALVPLTAMIFGCSHAELISFPGGEDFDSVSVDEAEFDSTVLDLSDTKDTGSYLFDSTRIVNKKLSLNFFIRDFISSETKYFRANPLLFKCLQKIQNEVSQQDHKIVIQNGYGPLRLADLPVDSSTRYHSTGSAVTVGVDPGTTVTVEDVVAIAVRLCVPIFQISNQDIGIVLFDQRLEIRIQGAEEEGPLFTADQTASLSQDEVSQLAWNSIDAAYDPPKTPICAADVSLSSGEIFPPDAVDAESIVGKLHLPITRNDTTDFARLVQYPGSLIAFENEERSAAWCGVEDRSCVDCTAHMKGFALNSRCADRTMSARLMGFLRTLGKLVSNEWPGVKLLVLEAWDEPHDGSAHTDGDQPAGSLHYEGRAAKLALSDGDVSKLNRLAGMATCAAADYVENKGDHVFIAAKKQAGVTATSITFARTELLVVEPPAAEAAGYQLPSEFQGTEDQRPLFDKDHQMDVLLSDNSTVKQFASEDGRYFRLSPHLLLCYQDLINQERKWSLANSEVKINVIQGFLTKEEHDNINFLDPRYGSPILGQGMELTYDPESSNEMTHHPERLMRQALLECGPRFIKAGVNIGVGLYDSSVFVDMRKDFHAWVEDGNLLGPGETEEDFKNEQLRWLVRAVEGRVVDPIDPVLACSVSYQPKKQSIDFDHTAASSAGPAVVDEEKCIPRENTAFCSKTSSHRQEQVERIWIEVSRKHLLHDSGEVRAALEGCVGACSTCKEGSFYEKKVEHCNNFLHWVPFGFLESKDQTNLYVRANTEMKIAACRSHCIDKTPLFSLMVPTVEVLYRPDPSRSVKERLYSEENNPSPVYELLQKLYAIHASGVLTVWVKDVAELNILQEPLKVAMLYNKNITQIKFYAAPLDQQTVAGRVAELTTEWTGSGCTDYTRTFLPPYGKVEDLPSGVSKRSPEHDLRESMLKRRNNWERRWVLDNPLI
ncbi:uncharacterized protein LOC119731158 [Patiria miniata]|uniref:Hedgehog N-terminal signalling domain-containing protein n=1 Tax=Patiria miniata TaxID=46514 RepID=A0A914A8E3_PATMI|nr:uncharacterized protein LOC119731158 [Patiria miniata]